MSARQRRGEETDGPWRRLALKFGVRAEWRTSRKEEAFDEESAGERREGRARGG